MSKDPLVLAVLTGFITLTASSGFWTWILRRDEKKSAQTRLIMGLAYTKAFELAFKYLERGEVSKDELEDFRKYLYDPYKELGGNGVLERLMDEVMKLPIVENHNMGRK